MTTKRRNDETTKRRNDETTKRRNDETRFWRLATILALGAMLASCTVPNPNKRYRDGGVDATVDAAPIGGSCTANEALKCDETNLVRCNAEGTAEVSEPCPFGCNPTEKACASKPGPVCTANQALRCDGTNLVRCNADGTGEASPQPCSLGCDAAGKRCYDMEPSNGLGRFLTQAGTQPDLDLGESATINTDNGDITVGGSPIGLKSETLAQAGSPTIRVLVVRSLRAKNVAITGRNALAIVSSGDINVSGVFTASGKDGTPGPGAHNDGNCRGGDRISNQAALADGGAGGGGFGTPGGRGGQARSPRGGESGAAGGTVTGNAWLEPLRGGCDGGSSSGGGGGAIQLASGNKITIDGNLAANGGGGGGGGGYAGGSGGGILLEAPAVWVSGYVLANGGAAGGCGTAPGGSLDGTPSIGSPGCTFFVFLSAAGGNGAAGSFGATDGGDAVAPDTLSPRGGGGGGGVGRIRVNTAPGGQHTTGLYSPAATFGSLGIR